ncbi:MAG: hypothetical protein ACXACI_11470 [Candidatus Hodarchaeales archaeon]|jgi:hypothetical protein
MPNVPIDIIEAYTLATEWVSERFEIPTDFRIYYSSRFFPVLLRSEAIRLTGSPAGLLSTPEERALQHNSKIGFSLTEPFLSIPCRGYLFGPEAISTPSELHFYSSQFIRLLTSFFLGENSLKAVSAKNGQLHQMDITLNSLLTRATNLSAVSNHSWIYQYFRDLAALFVRFSILETHTFHTPVEFEETAYAEFLRELIPYVKKRALIWKSIPLHRAILNGFSCLCARKYLRDAKSGVSASEGFIGRVVADVLESNFSSLRDIFDQVSSWKSDKNLLESVPPKKFEIAIQDVATPLESKKLLKYLKMVSELSLETNNDIWDCKFETDRYIGHLQSKKGPIYFYKFHRTQVVPEQLLILHNHAKPLDDRFSLPSTASIVAFCESERLGNLAAYFQPKISAETPPAKNPWDFPYYVNSAIAQSKNGGDKSEWDKFLVETWISKEALEAIGLNNDQLACILSLLTGRTGS